MKNIFDKAVTDEIINRIEQLTPYQLTFKDKIERLQLD